MRTILIFLVLLTMSVSLHAQNDFKSLDQKTLNFYNAGDYKSLKSTADIMLASGMDYYYLRIRTGISAFKKEIYPVAAKNFEKAIILNPLDTISREYIYYSFLLSGRRGDASLYLGSIDEDKKNNSLKNISAPVLNSIFGGFNIIGYDYYTYNSNKLYYEAVKSCYSFNTGFEASFLTRFKGTFNYTNLRKTGKQYNATDTSGVALDFSQNQLYGKLSASLFSGWEISGFGHFAFFNEKVAVIRPRSIGSTVAPRTEYVAGIGIAKAGWKLRTALDFSASNFSGSNQLRGEGNITYLPSGNLNLYFTLGGMYQTDSNWGETYQLNGETGLRITSNIWMEAGVMHGNSFLYARNQGSVMNNSLMIPGTSVYCNIIILNIHKFKVNVSPFFSENLCYSWNFINNYRTSMINPRSFGMSIKLTYKNKK